MKKFSFTLQALYDVKKTQKDKLQAEYAAAYANYIAALEMKNKLEKTLSDKTTEYESKARNGMTVSGLNGYALYFEDLRGQVKEAERASDKAFREANNKRDELTAVFKEIKVLEKLFEKQYGDYLKEFEKSETKAVEDIVSFKTTENDSIPGSVR